MTEIVNLNRFRKTSARAQKARDAAQNRIRFGRNKAERAKDRAEARKSAKALDDKKLD